MRKKYIAFAMSLALGASMMTGCSGNTTKDTTTEKEASADTVYGQIASISDDGTITIEVGSRKEPEMKENASSATAEEESGTGTSEEQKESEPSEKGMSILDLTGETMEISIGEDTTITRETMGGPGAGGQPPSGAPSGNQQGNPPEGQPPSGAPSGNQQGNPPEGQPPSGAPSGNQQGNPPQETEELTADDLSEGDVISVTTDNEGNVSSITLLFSRMGSGAQGNMGPGPGQSAGVDSYDSVTEYKEDTETDGVTYESTGTDENAVLVSGGASVTLNNATVTRNSSDSTGGDNSSFYGVGAAILTTEGTTKINNATITTDAAGGAGVFAYGDGVVYVTDSTIKTTQGTSGGIHVAGGGTLTAKNLQVETNGESSAAIRSDRGSGTMTVEGGTYTSNGTGSPAVYSTADITVKNATLTATNSEAVCIEGKNSLTLTDTDLTGDMPENEQNDCTWNVILYQSMSGDSQEGNATFTMTGGTLTAKNGGMFYTTNTESTFNLENVSINYAEENDFFLKATGNSNARGWGSAGANGADCTFTATDQEMEGDIVWDSISTLDFVMKGNSTLKGAVTNDESNAGSGGKGYCNLTVEKGSSWTVTGNSTLTKLVNHGTITDTEGNTVTVKGTDGTVYVKGSSAYVITVDSYEG